MTLNKFKLIGKSLKSYPIFIILGIIGTITILFLGDIIPNLILIIQLWAILTAYIILFIQFKKEKNKVTKITNKSISLIEDLLYYMCENNDRLLELQNETSHKLSILRTYYNENLSRINCFFTSNLGELFILTEKSTYYINPVRISKKQKGESINITSNKKEIDRIISELRALV